MDGLKPAEAKGVPDRDAIVGTWRPPRWARHVPLAAWASIGLAGAYVALRVSLPDGVPDPGAPAVRALTSWAAIAVGAATVALPAAVLVGPTAGDVRRSFLVGAVALAVAELIRLLPLVVPMAATLGPDADSGAPLGAVTPALAASLVAAVGAAAVLVGARRAAGPVRPNRLAVGLAAAGIAVVVLGSGAGVGVVDRIAGSTAPIEPLVVLGSAAWVAAAAAWVGVLLVATSHRNVAGRREPGWRLLAVAAGLIFAATVAAAATVLVSFVAPVTPTSPADAYLALIQAISMVGWTGRLVLVGALAAGPSPAAAAWAPQRGAVPA